MKFQNSKKGFVGILALILIVAVASGGGVYYYQKNKLTSSAGDEYQPSTSTAPAVKTEVTATTTMKVRGPDETLKIVPEEVKNTTVVEVKNETRVSADGNSLYVTSGGKVIQTLSLNDEGIAAKSFGEADTFITDKDVNFDGHNDIGVLSGSGYMGLNNFYDYYLYNPSTGEYVKSQMLTSVSIVKIDSDKKQITNSFKSGTEYMTEIFQWNGSAYVRSATR